MRSKTYRPLLTLLLVGALVALLAVLAVLQYHWLGQISVAERQTMQNNLHAGGRGLQEEINKEVEQASSRLQMSMEAYRKEAWGELIERYSRWKAGATYPGLIKSVFVARNDPGGQFNLMQLDESEKRLVPSVWPSNFSDIHKRFAAPMRSEEGHAHERREMEREKEERSKGSLMEHGYVAEDIPAVVRFLVMFEKVEEPKEPAKREMLRKEAMATLQEFPLVIIVLDIDYIKQTFVPALFKRRFTIDGALDYEMNVVYRRGAEEKLEKVARFEQPLSASGLTINMFMGMSSAELNHGSRWQIVINHQAGSLDAAVAQARGRNLLVSFGILSVLAVSMIIIIVISRRAQRLARKQMDFVAGVSHEFRTPLAVIHAVSENLADGLITEKQQIEQCGAVIRNDVRRLSGMVEQVLEFAGASRGKNLYQPQAIDLSAVIDKALAENPSLESQQGWRIEKEIEPDLPPVVADPTALTSAVRNIIDNAVKYGGDNHWIGIKAQTRATNHSPEVEITIADQGIGIPESDLPHIFEPFYRGRDVLAAQIHGNGLGLSLVKNILEAHGGTISVSSIRGKGSSFTLSLPAANGNNGNG